MQLIKNKDNKYKIENIGNSIYWLEYDFPEWVFSAKQDGEEYDLYVNINNAASVKTLFGFSLTVFAENNNDSSPSSFIDKCWVINIHNSLGGSKATREAKLFGKELETVINSRGGKVIFDDETQL